MAAGNQLEQEENIDRDSSYVYAALHGDGLTSLQYRLAKGGETRLSDVDTDRRRGVQSPRNSLRRPRHNQCTILVTGQ